MTIDKIEKYFKDAVARYEGGLIISSGLDAGKPYIVEELVP